MSETRIKLRSTFHNSGLYDLMKEPSFQHNALGVAPFHSELEFVGWMMSLGRKRYEVVVEHNRQVIGFGGLYVPFDKSKSHIARVFIGVKEAHRQQGHGARIMQALIEAAYMAELRKLELTVYVDNLAALLLYFHCGFKSEGTIREFARRGDHYVDAYQMALMLE